MTAPDLPPLPEPESFMYQHDETGLIGYVDPWQIENGFEANNPRLHIIGPLFTADQLRTYGDDREAEGRRKGMEEAAKACAAESVVLATRDMTRGALRCADLIRSLAGKEKT